MSVRVGCLSFALLLVAGGAGGSSAATRAAAQATGARLRQAAEEQAGGLAGGLAPPLAWAAAPGDGDAASQAAQRLAAKLERTAAALQATRRRATQGLLRASRVKPCPLSAVQRKPSNEPALLKPTDDPGDLKIKRQHFLAAADSATDADCRLLADDSRLRRLFHDYFQPLPKQIVFIIDNANRNDLNELRAVISVASEMIGTLRKKDRVAVITNDDILKLGRNCSENVFLLGDGSRENKDTILEYIKYLDVSTQSLNITEAVHRALDILDEEISSSMILYVGTDPSAICQIDIDDKRSSNDTIILNSCTVRSVENNGDVPICKSENRRDNYLSVGARVYFDSSVSIGEASSRLLLTLPRGNDDDRLTTAAPVWDPVQRDLLVPLILPCSDKGLIVADLYLADLAQDITYFHPATLRHRAFMIDMTGIVVMHSSHSRPEVVVAKPRPVDVALIEASPDFPSVRALMLTIPDGEKTIAADSSGSILATYSWRRVKDLFVICVVSERDKNSNNSTIFSRKVPNRRPQDLQYHRLDLLSLTSGTTCRHFKQVSTIDRGTLYLSPSSFKSPFRYLHDMRNGNDISAKMLQSCMAYLKDATGLLSNPGLKPEIRADVGTLYPMLNYYKRQHIHGSYNKYVVRRYAATDRGALVMFPGSILESDYEPTRKAWFAKAVRNPRRVILTPPYLDVGGAGYVVTVSYAPQETPRNSKPNVVVAMDITMGFLYKILADSLRRCSLPDVKCFIMDDRGYLLSHPSLFDRRVLGPIEQQHITHKETLIANDMLHHEGFVRKELCKNFVDGTLQRYYRFNVSLADVLTNYVPGEHCSRYYITAVEGTNTFLGMINSSCDISAFCPCSIADRVCLNCNRMEQNECECPCECALPETSSCNSTDPSVPVCELQPEKNNHKNHYFYNIATHLKSCFDFQCDSYRSESSCLGVLGCEWCHTVGESPLASPFCSAQSACFGGVLGAVTPYGEGSLGHIMQDDLLATYSAVGPIAGCIVAVCLILAIAVYCYKQNLTASAISDSYLGATPETWPDAGVQMNHLPSEDDIYDERSGHQDKLLTVNDLAVPISPYRVLTGCRRPNTAGESDHGYSTMTPHDDSEHLAFAVVEPFIAGEANASENAYISSRTKITDPITILPCGKNNVIAPVTVHRHMEAT